jgi:glutamate formiminotransferase / 5-formyltetrahydrofolate cyclo-ligase
LLLAVPNLSEGTDRALIDRLAATLSGPAALLDRHSDAVHGRSVFTLAAAPEGLSRALVDGARAALAEIDIRVHSGAHPCVGALDVCPIVHPDPADADRARELALEVAARLAALELPVFLYGALASSEERRERSFFRRGGLEALAGRMSSGDLRPDLGPTAPHPRGGAVLVTARPPLAAFNVELAGADLLRGREIAASLRESGGGLPGVRAIAVELGSGRIQISANVHDPIAVPLARVVEATRSRAAALGARPVAAELVGLVPEAGLDDYPGDVPIRGFSHARGTIEGRLAAIDAAGDQRRASSH